MYVYIYMFTIFKKTFNKLKKISSYPVMTSLGNKTFMSRLNHISNHDKITRKCHV